jgi:translation initiation factor IF-2
MFNEAGKRVKESGPSTPVEVLGLNSVPDAGDRVTVVENEQSAREIATDQKIGNENRTGGRTLEDVVAQIRAGKTKELNVIMKTDVQGSIEAVRSAIDQVGTEESHVKVLHAAAGSITESDVLLASASEAIIVAFNTRIEPGARRLADNEGVDIRFYSIIYRLSEDIETALKGLVEPTYKDILDGRAEVRATFSLGRRTTVAGCSVTEGRITRGSQIRLVRDGKTLFDGTIRNLRRFKDDVREVSSGYECGITLNGFDDFLEGDILEAHSLQPA